MTGRGDFTGRDVTMGRGDVTMGRGDVTMGRGDFRAGRTDLMTGRGDLTIGTGEMVMPDTAEAQHEAAAAASRSRGSSRPRGNVADGMLLLLPEKDKFGLKEIK